jgi:hypothetical protein
MVAISSLATRNVFSPLRSTHGSGLAGARRLRRSVSKRSDIGALKVAPRETAILIWVAGGGSKCDASGCQARPLRRSYLIFPRFLVRPSGFTVENGQAGARIDEEPGAALLVVLHPSRRPETDGSIGPDCSPSLRDPTPDPSRSVLRKPGLHPRKECSCSRRERLEVPLSGRSRASADHLGGGWGSRERYLFYPGCVTE